MDKISKERRSHNMSRIRSADTRIEMAIRRELWARGVRGYRVHPKGVAGKPDLLFGKWKVAVFVDGCFWHACPSCFVAPSSNTDYWAAKIARNVERDERINGELDAAGWRVLRIWEHEVEADVTLAVGTVERVLTDVGWRVP